MSTEESEQFLNSLNFARYALTFKNSEISSLQLKQYRSFFWWNKHRFSCGGQFSFVQTIERLSRVKNNKNSLLNIAKAFGKRRIISRTTREFPSRQKIFSNSHLSQSSFKKAKQLRWFVFLLLRTQRKRNLGKRSVIMSLETGPINQRPFELKNLLAFLQLQHLRPILWDVCCLLRKISRESCLYTWKFPCDRSFSRKMLMISSWSL